MMTNHALGAWPPPRILRSTDGVTWAPTAACPTCGPLAQDANTFLGDISTASESDTTFQNYGFRSGGQLNGTGPLYLQVGDFAGVGRVIVSGPDPSQGDNNYQYASPTAETLPVWLLQSFNGFMYAATGDPYSTGGSATQYGVWKTNGQGAPPFTWTPVIDENGAYAQSLIANYAMSFQIFADTVPGGCPASSGSISGGAGGCLYVGTDQPSEMVRIHPDQTGQVQVANDTQDSWDLVVGNPRTIPAGQLGAGQSILPISGIGQYFDNGFTGHFWRMGVGGMGLYMSTYDWSGEHYYANGFAQDWAQEFGTDLFRTPDGIHWTAVSKIGLGDGMNTGGRTFQYTPFGLYWGTSRPAVGGAQVYMIDNSQLDFNHDGVIDQKDVNLMTARLNTKAQPNDPMDLNQDGKITSADVELLRTQCTYKNCTSPAVRPAQAALGVPVLHSAPGVLGSTASCTAPTQGCVALDWPVVPNAVDYLVYRINMAPNDNTPPAGFGPIEMACEANPGVRVLTPCYSVRATQASTTSYGYPGAANFVTRVTATGSTATFSELSPTPSLQLLYYVRAEDVNGNLSAPSNLVGGPSLAAQ